jgi:hypothetical protein
MVYAHGLAAIITLLISVGFGILASIELELVDKVKALIHEGNVRRIIIKNEQGHTFVEIPVSVAAVGAVFAPVLAAVGALAAMAAKFTIVVEKAHENGAEESPANS